MKNFEFFEIVEEGNIAIVYFNKPEKRNAMEWSFWRDLPAVVEEINNTKRIRAFIFAGKGKTFSTGLDILDFSNRFGGTFSSETADKRKDLYKLILDMQKGINAIYESNKPSIAVVQRHCIGGALDLISACDIRYCSQDALFSLREAKVAIVADMGSINRLPAIIGDGNTRELALTGKDITAEEAYHIGLVNKVLPTIEGAMDYGKKVANEIASNSTFVINGVKEVMRHSEGKPLDDGLNYVAVWNSSFLNSKDFEEALKSFQNRTRPEYNKEN